jgi:hypothetical protein
VLLTFVQHGFRHGQEKTVCHLKKKKMQLPNEQEQDGQQRV